MAKAETWTEWTFTASIGTVRTSVRGRMLPLPAKRTPGFVWAKVTELSRIDSRRVPTALRMPGRRTTEISPLMGSAG